MSNTNNQSHQNKDKNNLREFIINGSTFLLIPMILFAIPIFISSSINTVTNNNHISPMNVALKNVDNRGNSNLAVQSRNPEYIRKNNIQPTTVVQSEPTPTEGQSKKNKSTKTPKPPSTPIPTPPPSDPSTNNLMAIFGILIVVVIIMGIWVNWRRVFR